MGSKYLTKKTFSWTSCRQRQFCCIFLISLLNQKGERPTSSSMRFILLHQGRDGPQGPSSPLHTPGKTDLTSSQHKCFISQRYTMIGLHNEEVRHRVSNSQKQGQATDAVHTYLWSDDSGQSGLRWGRVWPFWPYIQRDALLYYHTIAVYQTTLYYTAPLNINCVIYCTWLIFPPTTEMHWTNSPAAFKYLMTFSWILLRPQSTKLDQFLPQL